MVHVHARIQKCFSGGGGGVQIPRSGLKENFNMAKINNLAIPGGGGSGPPVRPSGSAQAVLKSRPTCNLFLRAQ